MPCIHAKQMLSHGNVSLNPGPKRYVRGTIAKNCKSSKDTGENLSDCLTVLPSGRIKKFTQEKPVSTPQKI